MKVGRGARCFVLSQDRRQKGDAAIEQERTRREQFLTRLEEVMPWARLLAVIAPYYPKGERGRRPVGLERMLRVYFL